MTDRPSELEEFLRPSGFIVLGGFRPGSGKGEQTGTAFPPCKSVLMIGSTGRTLWGQFTRSAEHADGLPDPLDRYTRRILTAIAAACGYQSVFPFDGPPYVPFQQWAMLCGGFSRSPMGVLAHRTYGPWVGLRAAFLSSEDLTCAAEQHDGPCGGCIDKPCLSACPVNAVTSGGYDIPVCRDHLEAQPSATCWSGCLARRACPIGQSHQQAPGTGRFHMESFMGLAKT